MIVFQIVFPFHWTTLAPLVVPFLVSSSGDFVTVAGLVLQEYGTPQKQVKKKDVIMVTHHEREGL